MTKLLVELYARKDCKACVHVSKKVKCSMCKEAIDVIGKVNADIPFQFKEVDIDFNKELGRRYGEDIPTVFINGKKAFKFKVDESEFRKLVRKELIKAGLKRLSDKKRQYT